MAEIVLLHQAEASGMVLNTLQWQPLVYIYIKNNIYNIYNVYIYIKPIESYCNDIGKDAVPVSCLI